MTDPLLVDTANRLFADTCTHEAIQAAERDGWAPAVWQAIADAGLPWIAIAEDAGGSGGTLTDGVAILRVAGGTPRRSRWPRPVCSAAGSLRGRASAGGGSGHRCLRPAGDTLPLAGGTVSGRASRVAWAVPERIVALVADGTAGWWRRFRPVRRRIEPGTNLAGEPRDTLVFDRRRPRSGTRRTASTPTRCFSGARSRGRSDGGRARSDEPTHRRVHE